MKNTRKFVFKFAITLFLCVGIVGCNGCEQAPNDTVQIKEPSQIIPIPLAKSLYDNYSVHREPIIKFYEDSIRNRKRDQAYMQQQYNRPDDAKKETAQNKTAMDKASFEPTRYVSYDYKTIKNYLSYIEQQAASANIEISTLRFYLSNYPDSKTLPERETDIKPKKNSIMISPTARDDKGEDFLFYLDVDENLNSKVMPLTDDFIATERKGNTGINKDLENRNEASVLPNFSFDPNSALPMFAAKSLTINEGSSHP